SAGSHRRNMVVSSPPRMMGPRGPCDGPARPTRSRLRRPRRLDRLDGRLGEIDALPSARGHVDAPRLDHFLAAFDPTRPDAVAEVLAGGQRRGYEFALRAGLARLPRAEPDLGVGGHPNLDVGR